MDDAPFQPGLQQGARIAPGPAGEDERMSTLGVAFLPQFPPERLRGIAAAADEEGLDELWVWED